MNQFKINIGDWSNDGHGETKSYLVSTSKTVEDAREAHFKIKEVTGIDIHSLANEYEEDKIKPEDFYLLLQVPGFKENFKEDLEVFDFSEEKEMLLKAFFDDEEIEDLDLDMHNELEFQAYPKFMAKLWIFLLNVVDEGLEIKLIEEPKTPSLNFYGFDKEGRHIDFVGYGTF